MYHSTHPLEQMTQEDYLQVEPLLATVEAMSRMHSQVMFVADMRTREFLHVSDSPFVLRGFEVEEMRAHGMAFFKDKLLADDLPLVDAVDRLVAQPPDDRHDWVLSFHFRLQAQGLCLLLCQKLTFLASDSEGRPWLVLGCISRPARQVVDHIVGGDFHSPLRYRYDLARQA